MPSQASVLADWVGVSAWPGSFSPSVCRLLTIRYADGAHSALELPSQARRNTRLGYTPTVSATPQSDLDGLVEWIHMYIRLSAL